MHKFKHSLKLPVSTKRAAQRLAKEDGVSLNQWIAVAVAQKIGVVKTAAEFFRERSEGASPDGLREILNSVPDDPPEELDRID